MDACLPASSGRCRPSQFTLIRRTTLPCISTLQLRPAIDRSRLNTQIPLPSVLGFKVSHALDFVLPAIPYRRLRKRFSCHDETWLACLVDCDLAVGWVGGVDTVGLAAADEVVGGLGEGVGAADFVDVVCGGESGDAGFGDVLYIFVRYLTV
jgi:hypothetical protein